MQQNTSILYKMLMYIDSDKKHKEVFMFGSYPPEALEPSVVTVRWPLCRSYNGREYSLADHQQREIDCRLKKIITVSAIMFSILSITIMLIYLSINKRI